MTNYDGQEQGEIVCFSSESKSQIDPDQSRHDSPRKSITIKSKAVDSDSDDDRYLPTAV